MLKDVLYSKPGSNQACKKCHLNIFRITFKQEMPTPYKLLRINCKIKFSPKILARQHCPTKSRLKEKTISFVISVFNLTKSLALPKSGTIYTLYTHQLLSCTIKPESIPPSSLQKDLINSKTQCKGFALYYTLWITYQKVTRNNLQTIQNQKTATPIDYSKLQTVFKLHFTLHPSIIGYIDRNLFLFLCNFYVIFFFFLNTILLIK